MTASEPPYEQEREWVEGSRAVLGKAFEMFLESGEWPKVPILKRHFAQLRQDIDVQAIADNRPKFPGEVRMVHQEYISLAIRHLRYLPAATALINVCLAIARQGAAVYRTPGANLQVSSSDPSVATAAEGDENLLVRAGGLLFAEQPSPLAGGGPLEDGWQYFVNESFVLDFENVATVDEFVAVQDCILEERYAQRQQSGWVPPQVLMGIPTDEPDELVALANIETEADRIVTEETARHPKAFISHASEDKDRFVTEFSVRLRANGIDAWVDRWEIAPGQSLVRRIFEEGIKDANAFIIVLSENSIDKPWVERELNAGVVANIEGGCQLIPVVLDGVEPPMVLRDTRWVRITDLANYEQDLQAIVRAVFGVEERPPLGPVPGYIARSAVVRGLNAQDAQVLAALASTALESPLGMPRYEVALAECVQAGLDEAAFHLSLEALGKAYLIKYQRAGGGFIVELRLTRSGFMRYLDATRADLPTVRRTLIALLVNEFSGGTNLETLAGRLTEPQTLVHVLLEELESKKMLTLVRTFGGTIVMGISALLQREL